MGSTSVTGVGGPGMCGKATTAELSAWANGPQILLSGIAVSEESLITSPPISGGEVTFPAPLDESSENYCVILTTLNGGYAYVSELEDTDDDQFSGFSFVTETECDCMYIVVNTGIRPTV